MKLKADFHIHTHYSMDSSLPPEALIERAREEKLDIIGVADHGTCKGALDTKKLAEGNPLVLIGQEIITDKGDMLVFGVEKDMEEFNPLEETCKKAKELGGFVIVPHPFDKFRHGIGNSIEDIIDYVDAIEVFNSMCTLGSFNEKARDVAIKHNKPMVAGSDAHFRKEVGKGVTMLECEKTEKSVFNAIRNRKTEILGKRISLKRGGIPVKLLNITTKLIF